MASNASPPGMAHPSGRGANSPQYTTENPPPFVLMAGEESLDQYYERTNRVWHSVSESCRKGARDTLRRKVDQQERIKNYGPVGVVRTMFPEKGAQQEPSETTPNQVGCAFIYRFYTALQRDPWSLHRCYAKDATVVRRGPRMSMEDQIWLEGSGPIREMYHREFCYENRVQSVHIQDLVCVPLSDAALMLTLQGTITFRDGIRQQFIQNLVMMTSRDDTKTMDGKQVYYVYRDVQVMTDRLERFVPGENAFVYTTLEDIVADMDTASVERTIAFGTLPPIAGASGSLEYSDAQQAPVPCSVPAPVSPPVAAPTEAVPLVEQSPAAATPKNEVPEQPCPVVPPAPAQLPPSVEAPANDESVEEESSQHQELDEMEVQQEEADLKTRDRTPPPSPTVVPAAAEASAEESELSSEQMAGQSETADEELSASSEDGGEGSGHGASSVDADTAVAPIAAAERHEDGLKPSPASPPPARQVPTAVRHAPVVQPIQQAEYKQGTYAGALMTLGNGGILAPACKARVIGPIERAAPQAKDHEEAGKPKEVPTQLDRMSPCTVHIANIPRNLQDRILVHAIENELKMKECEGHVVFHEIPHNPEQKFMFAQLDSAECAATLCKAGHFFVNGCRVFVSVPRCQIMPRRKSSDGSNRSGNSTGQSPRVDGERGPRQSGGRGGGWGGGGGNRGGRGGTGRRNSGEGNGIRGGRGGGQNFRRPAPAVKKGPTQEVDEEGWTHTIRRRGGRGRGVNGQ